MKAIAKGDIKTALGCLLSIPALSLLTAFYAVGWWIVKTTWHFVMGVLP